jgi:hypothetical protein
MWGFNVLSHALGFSRTTADVSAIQETYCKPEFLTWADAQLGKANPLCTYGSVTFDQNSYCAK